MKKRVLEIDRELNGIVEKILIPIRIDKQIDNVAFTELYFLLDELKQIIKGESSILRNIAGNLFFIYTSIKAEARHTNNPEPLLREVARLEDYLFYIYWDNFSSGPL